ncbi:unnamed protein product [Chironomus riparius]|uniref:Uncharacterized protein n=1 Tax=Chironomus riparius TaxID=315576 RepID=A0A9N9WPI0_9DIPT|nr:unnamed protein product [Chironomus riparius]
MSHNNRTITDINSINVTPEQNQHEAGSSNTANDFNLQRIPGSTPTNSQNQNELAKCFACKQSLRQHAYTCKGCEHKYHPFCIDSREESTLEKEYESFVCSFCVDLLIRQTFKINKVNNENSGRDTALKQTYPNIVNNLNPMELDLSSEENLRSTGPNRNNPNKISQNLNTLISNRTVTSEQFFFKLQLKKLPEVVDADVSWSIFYASFMDTKDLFTHYENVLRIQEAIKDTTVKRIGGKGLFNLQTYVKCIENVNNRLKQSMNFLTDEAYEIEQFPQIKAGNKLKVVEYIDKIRNFCTIAEVYDDKSYLTNRRFLANIGNIVPYQLRNKWESKQADLEFAHITPSLVHMVEVFDKEIPRIEASIRNDKIRVVDKKSDNNFRPKFGNKSSRFNNMNYESNEFKANTSKTPVGKYTSNENDFLCWYHKTNDHTGNRCKALWQMDGKSVASLAKLNHICTYCGQKQHSPCPFSHKLKCRTEGCGFLHHSLFCFKRKVVSKSNNSMEKNRSKPDKKKYQYKSFKRSEASNSNEPEKDDDSEAELQEIIKRFTNIKDVKYMHDPPKHDSNVNKTFNPPSKNNHINVFNGQRSENNNKSSNNDKTLLGVIVLELQNGQQAAFLLDSGSTVSLIEEELANKLDLKGPWFPLTLLWSGNYSRREKLSRIVKVKVKSLNESQKEYELHFRTGLKLLDYDNLSGVIGIDNLFAFDRYLTIKARATAMSIPPFPRFQSYNAPVTPSNSINALGSGYMDLRSQLDESRLAMQRNNIVRGLANQSMIIPGSAIAEYFNIKISFVPNSGNM